MDRRHALSLMGGLVSAGVAGLAGPARAAATPVIEWNQHMFSANTAKFPFHPQAVYKPDPSSFQADPLAAYEKHMKEAGIDRGMLVQPEPYGDDHRLVLDCLHRAPAAKFKGTSLFYPKNPQSPKKLTALAKAGNASADQAPHETQGVTAIHFVSFSLASCVLTR